MRLLMKIPLPSQSENPLRRDANFDGHWKAFLVGLGAKDVHAAASGQQRIDYAVFELADLAAIFDLAKAVHEWIGVKPEFLPEIQPKAYFGAPGSGR
jgi:hypothetical protein